MPADDSLPRYLQLLWDVDRPARRGPKPGLRIEQIGAAAVRLADRDGLGAVSMKSVADELSVTTMSLYRYLDSKDELLAVMVEVAIGPAPRIPAGRRSWRSRLIDWVRADLARLVAHPWVVVAQVGPAPTPNVLAWTEAGLVCFDRQPLSDHEKLSSLLLLDGFARNHVRQSLALGALGPGEPSEYGRQMAEVMTVERFPALAPALAVFNDGGDFFAEEFEFGLGIQLDGIAGLIDRRARGTRR